MRTRRSTKKNTTLVTAGRRPEENYGIVNPPVYHASTVTFPTVAELEASNAKPFEGVHYGRQGTPTTFALEEAVAALEGGDRAVILPSGMAAVTAAMLPFPVVRRPRTGHRQRLFSDPPLLQHIPEAFRCRDDLFRSHDRRRRSRN